MDLDCNARSPYEFPWGTLFQFDGFFLRWVFGGAGILWKARPQSSLVPSPLPPAALNAGFAALAGGRLRHPSELYVGEHHRGPHHMVKARHGLELHRLARKNEGLRNLGRAWT